MSGGESSSDSSSSSSSSDGGAIIPGLPRSISQSVLARVPRCLYPRLRRVSRAWRRALRPSSIYRVRAGEGVSESWLYATVEQSGPFHAYDPRAAAWRPLPPIPADIIFKTMDKECFIAARHLLVVGVCFPPNPAAIPAGSHAGSTGSVGGSGSGGGGGLEPVIWRYSLDTGDWRVAPPMATSRCLFASASDPVSGAAYVAGGAAFGSRRPLAEAEVYRPGTGWRRLPPMPAARKECSGFFLAGRFFVIGGSDDRDRPLAAAVCFDPASQRWSLVAGMWPAPAPSVATLAPPLVAVVRDVVYAWDHPSGVLKRYDAAAARWRALPAAPPPGRRPNPASRGWGIGFKAVGDELWLIGGSDPDVPFIDALRPADDPPVWRRVARTFGVQSFIYNCAVMRA